MEKVKKKRLNKGLKITLITLGSILGVIVLSLSSYVIYVLAQYYRIPDNQILEVTKVASKKAPKNQELTYTSFNIGFGAYSYDYTFFLDRGIDENGELHTGYHSVGKSKEETIRNTDGCISYLKNIDSDFVAIQEVDTVSNRAHFVNQRERINEQMPNYNETFAINFHSAYLFYPIYEPHGASTAGLQTMSKYNISNAIRKSYALSDSLLDKLFDLDRCFSANYIDIEGSDKQLVLINSHMSAYDEGGIIRNKQLHQLNDFMLEEYEKGNYVIAGGDFNHDLLTNNPNKPQYDAQHHPFEGQYTQGRPDWVAAMFDENKQSEFSDKFTIYASDNAPTCRGVDIPYIYNRTYISTVDGFVVSDNIEVKSTLTTEVKSEFSKRFSYSDHQPTTLTFKLI